MHSVEDRGGGLAVIALIAGLVLGHLLGPVEMTVLERHGPYTLISLNRYHSWSVVRIQFSID